MTASGISFADFRNAVALLGYGKKLPQAVYVFRPSEAEVPAGIWATIRRAEVAAEPEANWNLLKIHTDQFSLTFLSYPEFESPPHPALADATKTNLNTGSLLRTDYRARSNPPLLHWNETFISPDAITCD